MKIGTFSIVAGSRVCNAKCPFCVSRMTGLELDAKEPPVNWRNFEIACHLAETHGVTTALITGKGEPTLFPDQITKYLRAIRHRFPFVELQTNGLMLANGRCDDHLPLWYSSGLTTIALSLVHYEQAENQKIYQFSRGHFDLPALIKKLHHGTHQTEGGYGFTVRMTVMLVAGFIDTVQKIDNLVDFAKAHNVGQLTIRPIRKPNQTQDSEVSAWVTEHGLPAYAETIIRTHLEEQGTLLMTLPHGAKIYDYRGQNLCLSDCLTSEPDTDYVRQLIFFPDGSLRYDWQYPGARLL